MSWGALWYRVVKEKLSGKRHLSRDLERVRDLCKYQQKEQSKQQILTSLR